MKKLMIAFVMIAALAVCAFAADKAERVRITLPNGCAAVVVTPADIHQPQRIYHPADCPKCAAERKRAK